MVIENLKDFFVGLLVMVVGFCGVLAIVWSGAANVIIFGIMVFMLGAATYLFGKSLRGRD